MPYDVVAANQRATQVGAALGAQMFNNALRMQQLRSQEAAQRMHEQQVAQQMALQMEAHDIEVQRRADMMKAMARVAVDTAPEINVPAFGPTPGGDPLGTQAIANPQRMGFADALQKHVFPVIAQYDRTGQQAGSFLADIARARQDEAGEGVGNVRQVSIPGGGNLNVYVPPRGRGANQIVGGQDLKIETDAETGERFYLNRVGERVRIPRDPEGRMLRVDDIKKLKDAPGGAALLEWDDAKGAFVLPAHNAEAAQKVLSTTGNMTTATRSALEKQQMEVAKVFRTGRELAGLLTSENVGARGNLTRLWEGAMSQLDPSYKIGTATDATSVATQFRSGIVKGMKSDGNIAESERQSLEDSMPTVTSWIKGPQQAKSTLARILKQWGQLSRENAQKLGQPIFPQWLTRDEIIDQFARGQITREQADALRDSNGWLLIDALQSSALRPGAQR